MNNEDVPAWAAVMMSDMRGVREDVGEMKAHVMGSPGQPGMIVRVDRLETESERRREIGREVRGVAWGALVTGAGGLVAALWAILFGKHGAP